VLWMGALVATRSRDYPRTRCQFPRPDSEELLVALWCAAYNPLVPVLDATTLDIVSHSAEQTQRLGSRLGELLRPGDLVCLRGELGTGKTTFVQGMARGWGALQPATSPSFVLLNQYRDPEGRILYHADGYRLEAGSFVGFDVEELLERGALVIEWPERFESLPQDRLWIELRWVEDTRRGVRFTPTGKRFEDLLSQYRHLTYGG
jgi:tRNA threonylcarbamoyladenosine biosynthesis protein TsaE